MFVGLSELCFMATSCSPGPSHVMGQDVLSAVSLRVFHVVSGIRNLLVVVHDNIDLQVKKRSKGGI